MFLRIVTGVKTHFEARFSEWLAAVSLTFWGNRIAAESVAFTNPEAWAGLLRYMPENAWGYLCIAAGTAWLMALTVNGTFANTVYSKYSPTVRGVCAIVSAVIWLQVNLSVFAANSSGTGIYPLPLILSVWCVFHAWRDDGRYSTARSHARRTS